MHNDQPADGSVQTVNITVPAVTARECTCDPTTNRSGKNTPAAGNNPKSGQNTDGFYVLRAKGNVDPAPADLRER